MLRCYCSITGYELSRADAFEQYNVKSLQASQHPIFSWSASTLDNFMRDNFVKREDTKERVLLIHALVRSLGLIEYRTPLILDDVAGLNDTKINRCFTLAVTLFKHMNPYIGSTDKVIRELLTNMPTYRVTSENHDDIALFTNYLVRATEKCVHLLTKRCADEYDAAEDALNFKLAVMGLDSNGLEENDRLPKVFTPSIAEWASYHYGLAIGAELGSDECTKLTRILTTKVSEKTNINYLRAVHKVLQEVLPMPADYELDKAKSILTLNKIDQIITEHSKLMSDLLGTELETLHRTQGGVTWEVIQPVASPVESHTPTVVKVQDKNQKQKVLALLKRRPTTGGIEHGIK